MVDIVVTCVLYIYIGKCVYIGELNENNSDVRMSPNNCVCLSVQYRNPVANVARRYCFPYKASSWHKTYIVGNRALTINVAEWQNKLGHALAVIGDGAF